MTNAEAEAKFFGMRLLREDCVRIVGPDESVEKWFGWVSLTPEEYALNEDYLAQLIVQDCGLRRSWWRTVGAWFAVQSEPGRGAG